MSHPTARGTVADVPLTESRSTRPLDWFRARHATRRRRIIVTR